MNWFPQLINLLQRKAFEMDFDKFHHFYVKYMILVPGNRGVSDDITRHLGLNSPDILSIYKVLREYEN